MLPTSDPTASLSPSSRKATMNPTFPATAHASVSRSHSRTRHCMLTRRGLPSSPALGWSPLHCHLRPGSTTPAAAGKRAKGPGNRNHAESLRRSQVMRSRTGRPHMSLSHSRHPLQAQASVSGLHAGASRSSNFHFRVWDAVLHLVTITWTATENPP